MARHRNVFKTRNERSSAGRSAMTPADIPIRPIESDDAPELLSMMRELARFENQEHLLGATEEALRRDAFGDRPKFSGFIAHTAEEPAGFVTYGAGYTTWGAREFILVDDLFVRDGYRGRGIARRLMREVEKIVIARGTY